MKDSPVTRRRPDDKIIALAGNPNVGKSTIFNELTGLHQHTGNWPGKTVASATGYCRHNGHGYVILDIPGTYSLTPQSAEEEVAHDFLNSRIPDVVIAVCDATALERSLPLVLRILEITSNVIVCLNLMDEAKKKGIIINSKLLSKKLGVQVVETSARSGHGVSKLLSAVENISETKKTSDSPVKSEKEIILLSRELTLACQSGNTCGYTKFERKLDRLLTNRATGIPVMLLLLIGIFWITVCGANYPSEILAELLFSLELPIKNILLGIGTPLVVADALTCGVWRVLSWVVSVMLPPMAIFFPLFTLLEDLGYLPRVVFNLDRAFQKCDVCGKQGLTMCMGFGCNAAGVVGCRIIDSPRERLIAILTNSLVPCNGRFPALITLSAVFLSAHRSNTFETAAILTIFILIGILMTFLASKLLSMTLLKGRAAPFTLELPPYRRPQTGKVILRSVFDRTLFVLGRAALVAAPSGLVLWLVTNTGFGGKSILMHVSSALSPIATFIGLDGVTLTSFILGFPANEIVLPIAVMAYGNGGALSEITNLGALSGLLSANGWDGIRAICFMLFSIMHWPCSTTLMTIKKETGSLWWTLVSFLFPTLLGFISCAAFNFIARLIL